MKAQTARIVLTVLFVSLVVLGGCSKPTTDPSAPVPTATAPPVAAEPPAASNAPAAAAEETASCPVLGTTMPKSQMIEEEYKGKTYYLCCEDCVPQFRADPEKYIKTPAKPLPAGEGMSD